MEHGDRIKVVRGIHIRIYKKYSDSLLFGGIYGSTAVGRDTEHSDIEMMYVMKEGCTASTKRFLYRGLPTEVNLISLDDIRAWLEHPTMHTPVYMGNLQNMQLLLGENRQRQDWLEVYAKLPHSTIQQFFLQYGAFIGYESLNKIRSLKRRANRNELDLYRFEVIQEVSLALALLNRQPVTRGYYLGVRESFTYQQLPFQYKELAENFMQAEGVHETIEAGNQLLKHFEEFLQTQEIEIRNVQTLNEIEW